MHRLGSTVAAGCRMLLWSLMGMASLFAGCPEDAAGAEYRIQPSITLSEEFNDNIFLTPTDKQEDYITRVIPGIILSHKTAFWSWDLDAAYDYRSYLKRTRTEDSTHRLDLKNRTELIDNLLFFEGQDQYQRVSIDVTKDFAQQSLFVNQADQNLLTLNPYAVMRLGSASKMFLGYKYVNSQYHNAFVTSATGTTGVPTEPVTTSTIDHIGYLETGSELSSNSSFTAGIRYTRDHHPLFPQVALDQSRADDYYKTDVYAGPRYAYAPNSYVYCLIGESWLGFTVLPENKHLENKHLSWDLGINHRYSTMTLAVWTKTDTVPDPFPTVRRTDQPVVSVRRVDQFVASLTRETTARTSLSGSAGWYEYRNAATNHLENNAYRVSASIRHALSPKLTIAGDISNTRLHDYTLAANTYLYEGGARLEYRLLAELTSALGYLYTDSYSPDIYLQNYVNNRITLELTYRF